MQALPWKATGPVDATQNYLVLATSFAVTSRIRLPAIISATQDLWCSLAATNGLVGYSLQADPLRGTLATLSAWIDQTAVEDFVSGAAHQRVVSATSPWLRGSVIKGWRTIGSELPPRWETARERLAAPRAVLGPPTI